MGRSHALAYHDNPGFEIVGLSTARRSTCRRSFPAIRIARRLRGRRCALKPDLVSINTYTDSHADFAIRRWRPAPMSSSRSRWPTTVADARARRRRRQGAPAASSSSATSCATIRPGCEFIAEARELGPPLRDAHEPQPAILRRRLGDPQAADADRPRRSSTAACTIST